MRKRRSTIGLYFVILTGLLIFAYTIIVYAAQPVRLSKVTINPSSVTIAGIGQRSENLQTQALYSDGNVLDITGTAIYSSNNPAVAYVDTDQYGKKFIMSGNKTGSAKITASYNGKTGTLNVTVSSALIGISITPETYVITGPNTSGSTIKVTANYSDGTTKIVTASSTYTSSDLSIITVQNNRLISGSNSGTGVITASYSGFTAACTVTVNPKSVGISISPNASAISGLNTAGEPIVVKENFSDGSSIEVTNNASFVSNDSTIAYVQDGKIISGSKAGTAIITANFQGKTAVCTVDVTASNTSSTSSTANNIIRKELEKVHGKVSYIDAATTAVVGSQVTVTANFADGYALDVSPKTMFNTSDGNIAYVAVDSSGKKTIMAGGRKGIAVITAVFGGKTSTFTVTVN